MKYKVDLDIAISAAGNAYVVEVTCYESDRPSEMLFYREQIDYGDIADGENIPTIPGLYAVSGEMWITEMADDGDNFELQDLHWTKYETRLPVVGKS